MDEYAVQLEKQYFDEEVRRSFQNINYSQWERKKSAGDALKLTSLSVNNLTKGMIRIDIIYRKLIESF
jgi:hypothetical protein